MRSIFGIGFLLCLATAAVADQAFLTNGDRVTGKVQFEADTIVVSSPLLGILKVPRKTVVRVVMELPTELLVGQKHFTTSAVAFRGENATLELGAGETIDASSSSILSAPAPSSIAPDPSYISEFLRPWSFSVDAGFTAARGNTALDNLHFGFTAIQTTDRHRLNLLFNSLLAKSSTVGSPVTTTANALRGSARYEFNVAQRLFAFGLTTFDSNALQQLDLRSVAGGGMGFRVTDNGAATFDVFTGASFDNESFSNTADRNSGEFIAGQELTLRATDRTSFTHRLAVYPKFTNAGQYRVNVDSSVVVKLNSWLGWQSNVTDTYISDPLLGSRKNDVLVTTGIRFVFGKERVFKARSKVMQIAN